MISGTLTKLSIILMYRKIFPVKPIVLWAKILGTIVSGYGVLSIGLLIFAFSPVRAQWMPWLEHTNKIDAMAFWLSTAIISMLLDVAVLLMPQATVWSLRQTRKTKSLVSLVFLLGGV